MPFSNANRILTLILMAGLLALIFVSFVGGVVLRDISFDVARANPELGHLRVPVLASGLSLIGIFIVCLVLGEILLGRIVQGRIFTESSVRLLKAISWLFVSGILPLAALYVLTERNVSGSITQIYVILFAVVYVTAGLVFRLWANLIRDASRFKQEVELTV